MRPLRTESQVFDHYFMNHAYLSERWLFDFLLKFKMKHPELWDDSLQDQLEDEERHTKMCRMALVREGITPEESEAFSIQRALYERIGGVHFPLPFNRDELSSVANIIERRAALIYKLYLRYGTLSTYKSVIRTILQDEEGHKEETSRHVCEKTLQIYGEVESRVFNQILPAMYGGGFNGMKTFQNIKFWRDIFDPGIQPLNKLF